MSTTATETPAYPIASREFETVLTTHEDCTECQDAADEARSTAMCTGSVGATVNKVSLDHEGNEKAKHTAIVRRLGTAVVFHRPVGCGQCTQTKESLSKRDVPWMGVDITEYEEGLAYLLARGIQSVPFVHSDIGDWTGLRLDKLVAIGAAHKAASNAYYFNS